MFGENKIKCKVLEKTEMGRGKITEAKMAKVYSNPEGVNKARKKEYTM